MAEVARRRTRAANQPADPDERVDPIAAPSTPPGEFPAVAASLPDRRTDHADLAGTWFYVSQRDPPAAKNVYPPQYIETVVAIEGNHVRGRYRGRFQIADRAISPDVAFQFEGERNEAERYQWTGRSGARGEVQLVLVTSDSLRVTWFASELADMGLASGSAILIRRREP
jgi:hypothetical protein